MKKVLIQGLFSLLFFFAIWFALRQIDWMSKLNVEQTTKLTEEKLGNIIWDAYDRTDTEIKNEKINISLDSILTKICTSNHLDKSKIKIHLMQSSEINAYALPNNHLIINTGLIVAVENEAELCGVMCHEISHIEHNHVMNKLVKEIGLSFLISMTTGKGNSEATAKLMRLLSSTAYDRKLEKEADIQAVDYMIKANINPTPFADFLYRLSLNESSNVKYFNWISTHPDSKDRGKYIIEYCKNKFHRNKSILRIETWKEMKDCLNNK